MMPTIQDSNTQEETKNDIKKTILNKINKKQLVAAFFLFIFGCYFSFGTNNAGEYAVIQLWPSGDLDVVMKPGLFWTGPFSQVTRFKISGVVEFSEKKVGDETIDESIFIRFKDNGGARIKGAIKYLLPIDPEKIRLLKNELGNDDAIAKKALRNYITQILVQTAAGYTSSQSIRDRAGLLSNLDDRLRNGMIVFTEKISDGQIISTPNFVKVNDVEQLVRYKGPVGRYAIEILAFTLYQIEYDQQSQAKFDEQRLLEQQTNNAKIQAEKAQQEAMTAKAEGEKLVAQTKAREENVKLEAAIRAEKDAEIARIKAEEEKLVALTAAKKEVEVTKLNLEKAEMEKKVILLKADAKRDAAMREAEGRRAMAAADNSLELRLNTQKEMMIGMAQALKDINVPSTIIGASGHSSGNPVLDLFLMNQIKSLNEGVPRKGSGQ